MSLRLKILLSSFLLAVSCTALAIWLGAYLILLNQEENIENQLKATATTLMSLGISDYSGLEGFQKLEDFVNESLKARKLQKIIQVYTSKGKLMFSSLSFNENPLSQAFHPKDKPHFENFKGKRFNYKVFLSPYKAKNKKQYFLQIAMPSPSFFSVFRGMVNQFIILLILISIISFGLSWFLSYRLLVPVKEIADYLSQLKVSEINSWERLPPLDSTDYLSEISFGINQLIFRLKKSFYSLSKTSQYLAHEIRNPLMILMGEAETTLNRKNVTESDYKKVLESSLEEVKRIESVVNTVYDISRLQRSSYKPLPCDLFEWLESERLLWEKNHNLKIKIFRREVSSEALIDKSLLYRLLDNLLRNVKAHTQSDLVHIELLSKNNKLLLIFEDFGSGLDSKLIKNLNQRDAIQNEVGIGLSLCLEIAMISNLDLHFENKASGGLRVSIIIN